MPDHRRKWDKEIYEKLAQERLKELEDDSSESEEEHAVPVKRELLKPRDYKVQFVYLCILLYKLNCYEKLLSK